MTGSDIARGAVASDGFAFILTFLVSMGVGFALGAYCFYFGVTGAWEREAIDKGFASYVQIDDYGHTEWQWNDETAAVEK